MNPIDPIENASIRVHVLAGANYLFYVSPNTPDGRLLTVTPPKFLIDGEPCPAVLQNLERVTAPEEADPLPLAVDEHHFRGEIIGQPHLSLTLTFRVAADSPVIRFRYHLESQKPVRLTTDPARQNDLTYLSSSFSEMVTIKEVRFSEFNPLYHSFCPTEQVLEVRHFDNCLRIMGPMIVGARRGFAALLAYEHGSQFPDAFLGYDLTPALGVTLRAVKGNYCDGQVVGPGQPFITPWFQIAAVDGSEDDLARSYREWVLLYQTPNIESRKPYIFYNTWNYQERVKAWQQRPYLADMNEERMLREIDVAHRMGIDVFVLDTGWYEKTGDWRVSSERFPRGLAPIKEKLDRYGMKMGLWFNPTVAALSSGMHASHEDCLMTHQGQPHAPNEVWETEASQGLCLVSRYSGAFANELIRLHREVGVTYFKWDAIGQYGCDAPGHGHGTEENTPEERRQSYAFQLGAAMTRVVNTLCAACPDAIVDFDITEGGRTVGLQFLSAGKYFLVNNGPYSHDYQMPTPADGNVNLFFYPGPARTWICRAPLAYDRWFPSVLFLTHYLPDDTYQHGWKGKTEIAAENQWGCIASLVLGQNGIWGDLLSLSEEGVDRFGKALGFYKQVREDITEAHPAGTGVVGGSPEVHEKVSARTGRGVVCIFASASGRYNYVTENLVATAEGVWHNAGVVVGFDVQGRARIDATFGPGEFAKIIFFGVTA